MLVGRGLAPAILVPTIKIPIYRAIVGGDDHIAPPNICEENIGISVGNYVILPYGNVIVLAKSPGR